MLFLVYLIFFFSDWENDKWGTELRTRFPDMDNAFAVRRARGAGGYSSGAEQYEAHTKDSLLQIARQLFG